MEVVSEQKDWKNRWDHIDKLITRSGPFAQPDFEPSEEIRSFLLDSCRVLVIGAGGLGCELLKNLALSGFRSIDVIDMDTIDISNLNRQFLFRQENVGHPKATVAANFINKRVAGAKVTAHYGKIQDKDEEFYRQFNLVVCGLDSVPARRWINGLLISLLSYDENGELDPSTLIPMIDGGTEGFKGQSRVIFPGMTSCFECSLDTFPPQITFPLCTIANTPRIPAHCIEYAKVMLWPQNFPDKALDTDDPEHIQWLFERSQERAVQYGIQGVTYRLTQGVVKNIIPAIASTNAIIAASCANEAFKIATSCTAYLNNYMTYNGQDGLYTYTFEYEKKPDCLVCSRKPVDLICKTDDVLQAVIDKLADAPQFNMKAPGIRANGKTLYMSAPPALEKQTKPNLLKTLVDLGLGDQHILEITDPSIPTAAQIRVIFN